MLELLIRSTVLGAGVLFELLVRSTVLGAGVVLELLVRSTVLGAGVVLELSKTVCVMLCCEESVLFATVFQDKKRQ